MGCVTILSSSGEGDLGCRSVSQSVIPSVRPYIQLKVKLLKYSIMIPVVSVL